MHKVSTISGVAAPLLQENIDTDTIIRIERLMGFDKGQLGPYCMETLRFHPDMSEKADFVLNQDRFRDAAILIAGENFGCGSSREGAVWSLADRGIRCIISSAFGDIFFTNCLQNGLLPVVLPIEAVKRLAADIESSPQPVMTVDLVTQKVTTATGLNVEFSMPPSQRLALLEGLDSIALTLQLGSSIASHFAQDRIQRPWVYQPELDSAPAILILPGDGIGAEIMAQVRRVVAWFMNIRGLHATLREELFGIPSWRAYGEVVREEVWDAIHAADAILFGAIGSPEYNSIPREHWTPDNLLRMRRELGLFANLRPVCMHDSLVEQSSLRADVVRGADLMIVRELAGGAYFGQPRGIEDLGGGIERAINTIVYTTPEIERVARVAFQQARVRQNRVCSVDKENVLEFGALWRKVVQQVHDAEYPDVELQHMYVDNAAMQLVRQPRQFDVLVTENLFGDILSDCAAMVAGSIGMLPSASLGGVDAHGRTRALYEPIHGSAPDLEGKRVANPIGAIASFGMCLEFSLNRPQEATLLQRAIKRALKAGVRTADIAGSGPTASTEAMGDAVIAALDAEHVALQS